tara:strand:+ start:190 stop:444 length:255 start_codon:yes stop_codon:yes gene_type:complete
MNKIIEINDIDPIIFVLSLLNFLKYFAQYIPNKNSHNLVGNIKKLVFGEIALNKMYTVKDKKNKINIFVLNLFFKNKNINGKIK